MVKYRELGRLIMVVDFQWLLMLAGQSLQGQTGDPVLLSEFLSCIPTALHLKMIQDGEAYLD